MNPSNARNIPVSVSPLPKGCKKKVGVSFLTIIGIPEHPNIKKLTDTNNKNKFLLI
jgi:hypothetical protein